MKKNYVAPMSEIIALSSRDVITLSVEANDSNVGVKGGIHLGDFLGEPDMN